MEQNNSQNWHLGQNEKDLKIIDFEFLFWRTFYSWIRWQEDCQSAVADEDLTAYEIALLHVIKMKDRPKTIYELGRLLNRDDMPNIQYGVKKLIDLGYVKKVDMKTPKKAIAYEATKEGIENTEAFATARENILLKLINEHGLSAEQFVDATKFLTTMKGILEEASRITAFYKSN
jgi:predicted MarR family transcription regulator